MCNHKVCKDFISKGYRKAVGVFIFNNYTNQSTGVQTPSVLLGRERDGSYKGQYNLCAGGLETEDNSCWIRTAIRELNEEFKIKLDMSEFATHFKTRNDDFNHVISRGTPIFIGHFPGLSRVPLNNKISRDLKDNNLSSCYKEMDSVDWFTLVRGKNSEYLKQIEDHKLGASLFSVRVAQMVFKHLNIAY